MREYNGIIDLTYSDTPYVIYTITSSDLSDNSIYVGTTANPVQRVTKHSTGRKRKVYNQYTLYKWMNRLLDVENIKVVFQIIERDYTEIDAYTREIELVNQYRELGYSILNSTNGGKGPNGKIPWNKGQKTSETTVAKLRESHLGNKSGMLGKSHSKETKQLITLRNAQRKEQNWVNPKKKKVYKYDSNEALIKVYSCLAEAATAEGVHMTSIGEWCRKQKMPRSNNFSWTYE